MIIYSLLFSLSVFAADKPIVYLFGGVGATAEAMNTCGNDFRNIGYEEGLAQVKKIVKEINAHPDQKYIIAGHSSGAAYANSVAAGVKNSDQIKLVDLDGYAPIGLQERLKNSVCWYAENGRGDYSKNADSMRENCRHVKVFRAPHCKTSWCLHFALVNQRTPANLVGKTFRAHGYDNCVTNLEWTQP